MFTRTTIREIGFVRSNPQRLIYTHKDNELLILEELHDYNVAVLNLIEYHILITYDGLQIYLSNKPTKEEIEDIIKNI